MDLISTEVQKWLLEALDKTPDGLALFDHEDRLIFCNQAFASLFDMQAEVAIGVTFAQLIKNAHQSEHGLNVETDDVDAWLATASNFRRAAEYRSFEIDMSDGRWFLLTEQMIGDGGLFIFATEITEKKRAEEELLKLTEKLSVLANTDSLTGAHNRRNFQVIAEQLLKRATNRKQNFSLLLVDADHFKQINDSHGHLIGDKVLKALASCLMSGLRDYDVLGRIGGEEFAILLPETGLQDAMQIAERVRHDCQELEVLVDNEPIRLTVSIGLAVMDGQIASHSSLSQLMREADRTLYQAKNAGRNQVCFSAPGHQ